MFISEPHMCIYDAFFTGICTSSGYFISIFHLYDLFCNSIFVSTMMNAISNSNAEICFSDMGVVDAKTGSVLRDYMANYFKRWMFRIGWMPPNQTCFIKKILLNEFELR